MSFWGYNFIWDSIPGETYNLYIAGFESGVINSNAGANVELFKTTIYRRPVPYLYGVSQSEVLEFPITITCPTFMDGGTRAVVERWLFGTTSYKKLQIQQCDLDGSYFNCFLTNPESIYAGNLHRGFSCTVVCDSPWAWDFPRTLAKTYGGGGMVSDSFSFYNLSGNNDYIYPEVEFTTNGIGTSISIVNASDDNRTFSFTGINNNETITVDNDRQIITSSTGSLRLSKFNKKFFRLKSGKNSLTVAGGISKLDITYQFAKKFGG